MASDNPDHDRERINHLEPHNFRDAILILPTYDDITTASEDPGSFAYATGDGPTTEGIYWYQDGVGWTNAGSGGGGGADSLSELTIDTTKDWGGFSITSLGTLNGVTVEGHSGRHESGGDDEMNVGGLSGDLADEQDPKAHASDHHDGGPDEIDAAELAAALGTDGQVLVSDGAAAAWEDQTDTDTRVDVEHDGAAVVSDATVINFSTNLDVADDGGGEVTITSNDQDTRTNVSDGGAQVVEGVSDINVTDDINATDDGDGSVSLSVVKYTDEEAQDAVGDILDSSDIEYDDVGDSITLSPHNAKSDVHHTKTTTLGDITDVFGIERLTEDTSDNRPAPGTEGRIFFESDTGKVLYDSGAAWVDLGLSEDQISLGNLGSNDHSELSSISSDDHHTKTTTAADIDDVSADSVSDAHHTKYTDSDAESAINNDADHGSTASHDYFSGSHDDLTDVSSDDHHTKTTDSTDLTDVSADEVSDAHHAKYTDEEAQDAVGNNVGDGLAYDDPNGEVAMNAVTSGFADLSDGSATIDTGITSTVTATFMVALGPDTDDSEVSASIEAVSGGNYEVHLDEINSSVGNPTVEYDIIRVR